MNKKTVVYWIATVLLALSMGFDAFVMLMRQPMVLAGMASLGYPAYFATLLGAAKALGVIALLVPGAVRLKEWAYAGFTFTFIAAFFSHYSSGQRQQAIMPLIALGILVVSYVLRPPDRRLLEARPHNP